MKTKEFQEKRRTKKINIRVTPNEKAFITFCLSDLKPKRSVCDALRELIFRHKIVEYDMKYLTELTFAINKIGVNINQIARGVNVLLLKENVDREVTEKILKKMDDYYITYNELLKFNTELYKRFDETIFLKKENGVYYNENYDYISKIAEKKKRKRGENGRNGDNWRSSIDG